MDKYHNKYRINSTRLQNWDYGWSASYYITICTHHRTRFFGQIKSGKMHLSEAGFIAQKCWMEIPGHFTFVKLSDYVIMPDHLHGILSIMTNNHSDIDVETRHALSLRQYPQKQIDPRQTDQSTGQSSTPGQKRFQHQGVHTVSSIIGAYKSVVTKNSHLMGLEFRWQDRFWDHVIGDFNEFERIRKYINDNPAAWSRNNP